MGRRVKAKVVKYDDSEDDYGFKTLKKFIEKNKERLNNPKPNLGRKTSNRYAIIEPHNFTLVRLFNDIKSLGLYLDLKGIRIRVHNYFKLAEGDYSQLIKGYIIVKFTDDDTEDMDNTEFEQYIRSKCVKRIVSIKMDRIKGNLYNMNHRTVDELNKLLTKIDEL